MRLDLLAPLLVTGAAAALVGLERRFPYRSGQKFFRPGFVTDLLLYTLAQSWALGVVIAYLCARLDALTGLSRLHLVSRWPWGLQLLFFFVEHDLYIYLFHRWQHHNRFLWRIHEAHHSVKDVDWLAGARSHALEILVNQTVEFAPMVLLGASPLVPLLKGVIDAVWGMWIHSNVEVHTGWLQKILNGPEMHRWHHAVEIKKGGVNFATKLALWDWLFGTAALPRRKPRGYGLADPGYPAGWLGQHLHAFRPFPPAGGRRGRRGGPARRGGASIFRAVATHQARRPLAWLLPVLALSGLGGFLASRLELETEFERLLPAAEPSVVELGRLRARLAQGSIISIVLEGGAREELRRASRGVAEALERVRPPWLVDARSGIHTLREFLRPRLGLFASEEKLRALADELRELKGRAELRAAGLDLGLEDEPLAFPGADALRARLLPAEPALREAEERYPDGFFEARDGSAAVVLVRTSLPPGRLEAARAAYDEVRRVAAAALEGTPTVRAAYAGDLVTGLSEFGAVKKDLATVGGVGVALVLLVVFLFFVHLRVVAALGCAIAAGLAFTFGLTELVIGHLNLASAFLVSIVAGNGINAGIIYAARYLEARGGGAEVARATHTATAGTWLPTFGAALAAAAAYGSLGLTSFLGLKHFAFIGGAGMLLCWVATYATVPPLLVLAERIRPAEGRTRRGFRAGHLLAAVVQRRPATIAIAGALLSAASAALAVQYLRHDRLEYDARRMQNDLGEASALYRASARAREILGARLESSMVVLADRLDQVVPLERALEARRDRAPAGARPFEAVHALQDLVAPDQARKLPLLKDIARALREARRAGLLSDADWAEVAPLLPPPDLGPYGLADLPEEVARPYSEVDGTRGRVLYLEPTAGEDDSDLHYLLRFTDAFRETALPGGEVVRGSGRAVIFADILQAVLRDLPLVLSASFGLTVVAVVLTFRRGGWVAAVLGALLAGVALVLALLELLGVRLNFINFVALPVTFGIGVDYALNVTQRCALGEEVLTALRHTGSAVVLCSLTTMLSYLALLGSINQAIRSLGLVAVLGEACCLFSAVVLLPAALLWRERRAARAGAAVVAT